MIQQYAAYVILAIALVASFGLVATGKATWQDVQPLVFTVVGVAGGVAAPQRTPFTGQEVQAAIAAAPPPSPPAL